MVRPVTAAAVRPLRHALLRPETPPEALVYPGDDSPDALHVGAFAPDDAGTDARDERLVGIATVVPTPPPDRLRGHVPDEAFGPGAAFRLRGMATGEAARGTGLGRSLLEACVAHVRARGGQVLWCDARLGAVGFYRRMGLGAWGDEYDVPGAGRHVLMWRRV